LLARGNSKFKGGAQGTSPNKNCMRRVFFRKGKARFSGHTKNRNCEAELTLEIFFFSLDFWL
jgi:hypothetical protein